jgi:hypothetical protein
MNKQYFADLTARVIEYQANAPPIKWELQIAGTSRPR